ncbi:MAG: oxygenase MpaB family protein [Anaerolineales bacterium]
MFWLLRYQHRRRIFADIHRLDPQTQHEQIVFLSGAYHFPFAAQRALEFALFRTYAVPSISALLDQTGNFRHHGQKRYDDTALIIAEMGEHGYSSPRGQAAIRRMNALHGRFAISNDDFLYVLASFIYEPERWNKLLGWRRSTEHERLAYFYFWRAIGQQMGIQNIPASYDEFYEFMEAYERDHYRYAPSNARVARASLGVFLNWFPRPLWPLIRRIVYAAMEPALAQALGFPVVHPLERRLLRGLLRGYALWARFFPPRREPYRFTHVPNRTYPHGYQIDDLGS